MAINSYEDWENLSRDIREKLSDESPENSGELAANIRETAEFAGQFFGTDHPEYASSMLPGAVLLDKVDKNRDAFDIYRFCLDTFQKNAPDHPDYPGTIRQVISLGGKHSKKGELADAQTCYSTGLSHYETLCEVDSSEETVSDYIGAVGNLSDLAAAFRRREENESAGRCYEICLGHYENTTGKQNREYALILGELGLIHETMGDFGKAEQYYVESLHLTGKTFGKENEDYATVLYNLGDFYFNVRNDLGKARLIYQDCLDILETVLGEGHYRCAWVLNNLARIHESSDSEQEKAEKYYNEALSIIAENHGERHPDFVGIAYNLALLCRKTGKYDKAEKLLNDCLDLTDTTHPLHSGSLSELALLHAGLGQHAKAVHFALKEIEIAKEIQGTHSKSYAHAVLNLAQIHETAGDYMKSWLRYLSCLGLVKRIYGKDHAVYLKTKEKCRDTGKKAVRSGKSGVLSFFKRASGRSPAKKTEADPVLQPIEDAKTEHETIPAPNAISPAEDTRESHSYANPERDADFSQGMARFAAQDYNGAIAFFKQAVAAPAFVTVGSNAEVPFHSDTELYSVMGDCCLEKGDIKQAIRQYRVGLKSPENPKGGEPTAQALADVHCKLAKCLCQTGDLDNAACAYEAAVEQDATEIRAWFGLVEISHSRENYDEAVAYCRKIISIDKNHTEAYRFEAKALKALGKLEEAEESEEIWKRLRERV